MKALLLLALGFVAMLWLMAWALTGRFLFWREKRGGRS